jgi:transcription elongation factor GreA
MTEDADATKNMISTSSPIGKGLLGKEVGDMVKVAIPGGSKELEIVELVTLHDAPAE